MSRPIPGKTYTVVSGDTLSSIASIAYGNESKWPLIYSANQNTLKTDDPNLIFPGEVIIIPEQEELKQLKNDIIRESHGKDDFEIEINGRIIPIISGSIIRTMDTAADAWSAMIEWVPGKDDFIDRATAPYSYAPAKAYINQERIVTGLLFKVTPELSAEGSSKKLVGYSATINIVDSNLQPDNYEDNNISLKDRAIKLLKPYGLRVFVDSAAKDRADEIFDMVAATEGDTIFSHLKKLALQKKVLISSTPKGNLLITRANVDSPPVGTIEEDAATASLKYSAEFDGRKRFSLWRVTCQTPLKEDKKSGISKDVNVPIMRFKNISVDNDSGGGIQETAEWIRSKEFIKAFTVPFPFPSFFAPNGEVWKENTTVTVKSATLGIKEGFTFLIRAVEFKRDSNGDAVILSLVPPQVYTGEVIDEPWRVS